MKLFDTIVRDRTDALFVGPGPFFNGRRVQLAQLATATRSPRSMRSGSMSKSVG